MDDEPLPNFRGSRMVRVIETVTLEGAGTRDDIAREVTTYTDLEGNVLARRDPAVEIAAKRKGMKDAIDRDVAAFQELIRGPR